MSGGQECHEFHPIEGALALRLLRELEEIERLVDKHLAGSVE